MDELRYEHDGTVEGGAANMPDLGGNDVPAKPAASAEPNPAPEPDKTPAKPDAAAREADPEDDEDYLELEPAAEGKEAVRHKLSEVVDGFKKYRDLEVEAEELRSRATAVPTEYAQRLPKMVELELQYADALKKWADYNAPKPPPLDMLNPQHPSYDPDGYHRQAMDAQRREGEMKAAREQEASIRKQAEARQQEIESITLAREQAKVHEFWPELKTPEGADAAVKAIQKHYGLSRDEINGIADHRFFKLAKDAISFHAAQARQAEAVKAVTAKPKLIKSSARAGSSKGINSDHFGRLQKSGTLDDAANVLGGLI